MDAVAVSHQPVVTLFSQIERITHCETIDRIKRRAAAWRASVPAAKTRGWALLGASLFFAWRNIPGSSGSYSSFQSMAIDHWLGPPGGFPKPRGVVAITIVFFVALGRPEFRGMLILQRLYCCLFCTSTSSSFLVVIARL